MEKAARPVWPAVPYGFLPEFTRAEGAYLFLADGRPVLDAAGQACVANIGYGRAEVADVVREAIMQVTHALPPIPTPQRVHLVNELRDRWLPKHLTRLHFVNSGSEAAEAAIKVARQYHRHRGQLQKWKVIGRQFSYHGITLGALAVSGHAGRRRGFEPLLIDMPMAAACYPYRCDACRAVGSCNLSCAEDLERVILEAGPETVAAFIAEPVVGTSGGAVVPSADYWSRVQEICRRYDVLLIADEVITGFGRTGARFAVDDFGIVPDILTMAKGLTGGYAPLGGIAIADKVIDPIAAAGDDLMFHTFGGHPPACAAALKVLEILEREHLVTRAATQGERLGAALRRQLQGHPNVGEIRGRGMLWAVELVADTRTRAPFEAAKRLTVPVVKAGLERGVFFYPGGTGANGDVIVIGPPLTIGDDECELIARVLRESLDHSTSTH